jgi:hypothetical protein
MIRFSNKKNYYVFKDHKAEESEIGEFLQIHEGHLLTNKSVIDVSNSKYNQLYLKKDQLDELTDKCVNSAPFALKRHIKYICSYQINQENFSPNEKSKIIDIYKNLYDSVDLL